MSESSSADASAKPFVSALPTGKERFLAQVMVHALEDGWRTPEDFVRTFAPPDVIKALANNDELRGQLLILAAGVHEKLARKKSIASASEDLSLALSEGVCDAEGILEIFTPDDRVRHLVGQQPLQKDRHIADATTGGVVTRITDEHGRFRGLQGQPDALVP